MKMKRHFAQDRKNREQGPASSGGFTLIEVLVAIVILTVGLLAVGTMQISAIRGNFMSGNTSIALSLASEKMEDLLNKDFNHADLSDSNTGNNSTLSSITSVDHQENISEEGVVGAGGFYRRIWNIANETSPTTKSIMVIVTWENNRHRVSIASIRKTVRSLGGFMHSFIIRLKSEEGNLTIIAFVLLVVLTLIGVFATKTAQIDLQTAYNEVPYKQNFYVAEGGVNREAAELGRGMYPVTNVNSPQLLATQAGLYPSGTLPGSEHKVLGNSYDFNVRYLGALCRPERISRPFISAAMTTVWTPGPEGRLRPARFVSRSRLYKIGPKAE